MSDGSYTLALISLVVSFFVTIFLVRIWMRAAKKFELVGKDLSKVDGRLIPESGGLPVMFGVLSGLLLYVFFKTFLLKTETNLLAMFAVMMAFMLAGFLGFVDDILGWKRGLAQWQKPLLTLPVAVPLMVLDAGHHTMTLPIFGPVNFGLAYPLIIIPVAIVGAANGFNMLAGLNGLEAGMGAIILGLMGYVSFVTGNPLISLIAFSAVAALLAFLVFNKYPAKIFPGNSLTYGIGALIAILAILGDMERIAAFLFIPYFAELLLKARYRFKLESTANVPQSDGTLLAPERTASLVHIFVRRFKTEKLACGCILLTEIFLALLVLIFYI
jgi:UDP-N-acetylglucosamine--dolichyl-phosphate N-acetylglucosaminephosphotransferase